MGFLVCALLVPSACVAPLLVLVLTLQPSEDCRHLAAPGSRFLELTGEAAAASTGGRGEDSRHLAAPGSLFLEPTAAAAPPPPPSGGSGEDSRLAANRNLLLELTGEAAEALTGGRGEDSHLAANGSLSLELTGEAAAASSGGRGEAEAEAQAESEVRNWNSCPTAEPACTAVSAGNSSSAFQDQNASSNISLASSGHGVGRIAVYIYSIGGYERVRENQVPCVPEGVDAFLFLDDVNQTGIPLWEARGWQVKHFPAVQGTRFVKAPRLTAKQLKFTPPSWLLHGPYDWVVSFDMNMNIDLARLPQFLAKYADQPVVLLDWQHWERQGCPGDGMQCFLIESDNMISGRIPTITTSLLNCEAWQRKVKELHADRTSGFEMPYYYDMSIFFRNLRHPLAPKVESAFAGVYKECHNIERDQFVTPYYVWKEGLTSVIKPMSAAELKAELGHCNVEAHAKGRW